MAAGTLQVLVKNPQLSKVMLAAGLQAAASSVSIIFVGADQKAKFWGQDLASIQAGYAIFFALSGILGGSLYGRFSDSVDRRLAAGVYGLLTFLPGWAYLCMGLTSAALTVSQVLQVVACFGTGSNVMLVLAQDVAKPEEHEAAFGAFYMVNSFVTFVFLSVPILLILVLKVIPDNPYACLWYQVALSAGFFVCISSVKLPPKQVSAEDLLQEEERRPEDSRQKSSFKCISLQDCSRDNRLVQAVRALVEPLRLGCGDANIRASCLAAIFIAFSGDLVMDIGGQYFQDSLGILPAGCYGVNLQEETTVSVLSLLPPQLAIIPGYALAAMAMKRLGSGRLVRILIPVSTLLTSSGALFKDDANNFTLGVTVVLLTYASLVNVPLFAFVKEVAPSDRIGEAMGAVGSCQQISNFLGNLIVIRLNPVLLDHLGPDGLWIYYPGCGLLTLAALIPILLMKTPAPVSTVDDQDSSLSSSESSESEDSN